MTNTVDIVGIGICTVDHLLKIPNLPESGGNAYAEEYLHQAGGLVASALVTAQRLGATTKVIARLGDDEDGAFIRNDLDNEGVDTSLLRVEAGSKTHISIVLVETEKHERSFVGRWATGSPIAPSEFTQADITSAKILFFDNVTEGTKQAVQWATDADMTVVMDPAASCPLDDVLEILPLVDVPIVPEKFAQKWMPDNPPEDVVKALVERGAEIAVVTLGERGSVVCTQDGVSKYPAYPVDVVDTTGAGDAYHGAFMVGLIEGWDVPRIARFASAVGSLNCRALGGRTGLPTRDEVETFIAEHS